MTDGRIEAILEPGDPDPGDRRRLELPGRLSIVAFQPGDHQPRAATGNPDFDLVMRYIDGGEDSAYHSTSMGSGSTVDLD